MEEESCAYRVSSPGSSEVQPVAWSFYFLRFSDSITVERASAIKQCVVTNFLVQDLDKFQVGL